LKHKKKIEYLLRNKKVKLQDKKKKNLYIKLVVHSETIRISKFQKQSFSEAEFFRSRVYANGGTWLNRGRIKGGYLVQRNCAKGFQTRLLHITSFSHRPRFAPSRFAFTSSNPSLFSTPLGGICSSPLLIFHQIRFSFLGINLYLILGCD